MLELGRDIEARAVQRDPTAHAQSDARDLGPIDKNADLAGTPLAFPGIAARLFGTRLEDKAIEEAAADAARETDPGSDLHATKEYRRHLARVLAARALREARDAEDRQRDEDCREEAEKPAGRIRSRRTGRSMREAGHQAQVRDEREAVGEPLDAGRQDTADGEQGEQIPGPPGRQARESPPAPDRAAR